MDKQKNQKPKDTQIQAITLSNLVDYQKDSIVSHTIIDKKNGNVTLFAFDDKQGLSEHTAPFDALIYVLEGEMEATISGELKKLKKGDVIIMPANQPHSLAAKTKFKMLLTMIKS